MGTAQVTDLAGMGDMTVLRQIAAHLDGWSDLRTRVATEGVGWPSVRQRDRRRHQGQLPHAAHRAGDRLTLAGPVVLQGDGVGGLLDASGDQASPGHVGQHPDELVAHPDLRA
jgi:hypothetical protein